MEDEDNSFEAILWLFLVTILIFSIIYYINYYLTNNHQIILIPDNKNDKIYNNIHNDNKNDNKLKNIINNPPPPKLVNLYNEDY